MEKTGENTNEKSDHNKISGDLNEKIFTESTYHIDYIKMFPNEFKASEVNLDRIHIIYEDNHIIVVLKPSGVDSAQSKYSKVSIHEIIYKYLEEKASSKSVFLGLVHRLDKPTSGLMVFAKSKRALKILNKKISNGQIDKKYLAIVKGDVFESRNLKVNEEDRLSNYLCKNSKLNKSFVCEKDDKNSKKAELIYSPLRKIHRRDNILTLIEIKLLTGRHHQIRVQMSNISHPIYHDSKYDKKYKDSHIRLFSYYLSFDHPIYPGIYIFDANRFKEEILIEVKDKEN